MVHTAFPLLAQSARDDGAAPINAAAKSTNAILTFLIIFSPLAENPARREILERMLSRAIRSQKR
jgi:hypothetical protein